MKDAAINKRLGQYFSGYKVASLLADLCAPARTDFVIDPMAGIGDMIAAIVQSGVPAENTSGIEIDPEAGNKCQDRISPGHIFIGDAFSPEPYAELGRTMWDLVITNPPYVRYQSMGNFECRGIRLKNAKETRHSLRTIVNSLGHLSEEEKTCFLTIISHYSGLSDLAVPAWLLCAALAKVGGKIAMVVPESWISRDYALSVKYMLLKCFDIEYIVEDSDSVWFPGTLVKTNLLVAKRVELRQNISDAEESKYKHIRLSAELIGETSLIEKLKANGKVGRSAFLSLLHSGNDASGKGYDVKHVRLSDFLAEMAASQAYTKLMRKMRLYTDHFAAIAVPKALRDILGHDIPSTSLVDLEAWGIQVGQGLRTGANKFFYLKIEKNEGSVDYLVADKIFGDKSIPVSQKYSLPAFRHLSDSKNRYVISKAMLPHRLLYIQEDFYTDDGTLLNAADVPLDNHINDAENMSIVSNGQTTRFSELSAVKPNIRVGKVLQRRWFMLPALTNRHTPQLCISRVNYRNARCCFLADDNIVVDANFSTLWATNGDKQRVYALFALLNSAWVQSYLETIATVMGGGALKVEASHIRRLLLPIPTDGLIASLDICGRRLAESETSEIEVILSEIDRIILRSLIDSQNVEEQRNGLCNYLQLKVNARQR